MAIVLNQLYYTNIISTALPISLFVWGIWIRPWPSARYWMTVTVYVEAGMFCKSVVVWACSLVVFVKS